MALVQREQDGSSVLETSMRDAQNPEAHHVTTREVFPPASHVGDAPKTRAVQVDSNDPMEYPSSERPRDAGLGLKAFGPQTYVTTETIRVAAGTYQARKFSVRHPDGGESVLWLDHRLYPLGIVKMQTLPPSRNPEEGSVMELVATGDGARPIVFKPARLFDPQAYQAQMTAGVLPDLPSDREAQAE